MALKGQDVMFLLKCAAHPGKSWSFAALAKELGMSTSEVHAAANRALQSHLVVRRASGTTLHVHRRNLIEFLVHGLRYVFPAERGELTRGILTAHAAPVLQPHFEVSDEPPPVWPYAEGRSRGQTLKPLYKSVPIAARRDEAAYEFFALADALRAGRARDRDIAAGILRARLTR